MKLNSSSIQACSDAALSLASMMHSPCTVREQGKNPLLEQGLKQTTYKSKYHRKHSQIDGQSSTFEPPGAESCVARLGASSSVVFMRPSDSRHKALPPHPIDQGTIDNAGPRYDTQARDARHLGISRKP